MSTHSQEATTTVRSAIVAARQASRTEDSTEPHAGSRHRRTVSAASRRAISSSWTQRTLAAWFQLDLSPQFQIEPDPDRRSEVEVRFVAEAPDRTRVELEHRNLDRHGEGWEGTRAAVRGDAGWPLYLQRFAEVIGGPGS